MSEKKYRVKIYTRPIVVEVKADNERKARRTAVKREFYEWDSTKIAEVEAELKEIEFTANCPYCDKENHFALTREELNEDFDFTCSNCGKQSPLSKYDNSPKITNSD